MKTLWEREGSLLALRLNNRITDSAAIASPIGVPLQIYREVSNYLRVDNFISMCVQYNYTNVSNKLDKRGEEEI